MLAYPSIYEGFGFPLLEAMSADVPVVAARAGSIPEVAGDAALLVEATDDHGLAAALDRVLTDEAIRAELVARGRDRLGAGLAHAQDRLAEGEFQVIVHEDAENIGGPDRPTVGHPNRDDVGAARLGPAGGPIEHPVGANPRAGGRSRSQPEGQWRRQQI